MFSICGDLFDIDLKVIMNRLGVPPFVLSVQNEPDGQ
jgi:O-glycosyl hydrolase